MRALAVAAKGIYARALADGNADTGGEGENIDDDRNIAGRRQTANTLRSPLAADIECFLIEKAQGSSLVQRRCRQPAQLGAQVLNDLAVAVLIAQQRQLLFFVGQLGAHLVEAAGGQETALEH